MSEALEEVVPSMKGGCEEEEGLNLKATELRLGLPGCESPEREGVFKSVVVSGAKRGFSDAIDGNWNGGGSEKDAAALFSPTPRGAVSVSVSAAKSLTLTATDCTNQPTALGASVLKETVPHSPKPLHENKPQISAPAAKTQVVGWPPIRSFRKNSMASRSQKIDAAADAEAKSGCLYVKVSMEGAPYLRKVDLNSFTTYKDLSLALEKMFSCFTLKYVLTFEDKDGDWMLVGDVPWEMFTESCKRLRIMKSSEAIGLAPRAMEKCKSRN